MLIRHTSKEPARQTRKLLSSSVIRLKRVDFIVDFDFINNAKKVNKIS